MVTSKKIYRVLIVEDEEHLAVGLSFNLQRENFLVALAQDGKKALELFESFKPQVIILDLMIPVIDGIEVLKTIRQTDEKTPIIVLSARNRLEDKISGLKLGVDDYLTKPFSLEELLLRLKSLLKKVEWYEEEKVEVLPKLYQLNNFTIDMSSGQVIGQGGEFILTEIEIKLLQYFFLHPNRVIDRQEFLTAVWGYNKAANSRTLDNFIVRLRKYFEADPKNPQIFMGLRGKGYLFKSSF